MTEKKKDSQENEEQTQPRSRGGLLFAFVLFCIICGAGYFALLQWNKIGLKWFALTHNKTPEQENMAIEETADTAVVATIADNPLCQEQLEELNSKIAELEEKISDYDDRLDLNSQRLKELEKDIKDIKDGGVLALQRNLRLLLLLSRMEVLSSRDEDFSSELASFRLLATGKQELVFNVDTLESILKKNVKMQELKIVFREEYKTLLTQKNEGLEKYFRTFFSIRKVKNLEDKNNEVDGQLNIIENRIDGLDYKGAMESIREFTLEKTFPKTLELLEYKARLQDTFETMANYLVK